MLTSDLNTLQWLIAIAMASAVSVFGGVVPVVRVLSVVRPAPTRERRT